MRVRDHYYVQMRKVHMHAFHVRLQKRRIVSRVEEDALAVVLDQSLVAPVKLQLRFSPKRIGKNRDAVLRTTDRGAERKKRNRKKESPVKHAYRHMQPAFSYVCWGPVAM